MNLRHWWWVAAGVPALTSCGTPNSGCGGLLGGPGSVSYVAWDGGTVDSGIVDGSAVPGQPDFGTCRALCPAGANCTVVDAGLVECRVTCIGGRAPPGLISLSGVDATVGSWLARMAELEAAAVEAFIHLAKELDAHGLPHFADAALRAAGHEIQHATKVTGLALRHGRAPQPLALRPSEVRSLEALALDNAGEGCGREAFGALVNQHQARTAADPAVASVMRSIAGDELAHADLSFALAEALMPRLTVAQRGRAREAQASVLERLSSDDVPDQARQTLGLMDANQATAAARAVLDQRRL
jgi:hypothetical protein